MDNKNRKNAPKVIEEKDQTKNLAMDEILGKDIIVENRKVLVESYRGITKVTFSEEF